MPETKNATFRAAVLTQYNLDGFVALPDSISYLAWGEEVCPTTNRPHLQAFAYANVPMRLGGWKKKFPGAHIEPMMGNFRQNEKYCSKEGKFHELGEKPMENGKKRVLLELKSEIDSGASYDDLVQKTEFFEPCLRYRGGLQHYEQIVAGKRRKTEGYRAPEVIVIVGPSNRNKTRTAWDTEGYDKLYPMPRHDMKWCGSYNGQEAVLFDDITPKSIMPLDLFLRVCDGYPMEVESKGGFKWWNARRIYFTSNLPMEQWWPDATSDSMTAALRRVTSMRNLYLDFAPPEEHVSATTAEGAPAI